MLNLQPVSSERWLAQVDAHLAEVLIDHAHCERKAAGYAMSMINAYVEHADLCREMAVIVNEELEHFQLVREILARRGIAFTKQRASNYGSQLQALVRPHEPQRAMDRLLVAALIEARSCQRFALLSEHTPDAELAEFYASLFESEARHHTTYVRLAKAFGPEDDVQQRLRELSGAEAEIIERGDLLPRMHS
jgi:tRNA 2-(methylsulfanyl)-N6-isopentenyladenosine37 hydroxylase